MNVEEQIKAVTHSFVFRCKGCGAITGVMMDIPACREDMAIDLLEAIVEGSQVEYVADAHPQLSPCKCADLKLT